FWLLSWEATTLNEALWRMRRDAAIDAGVVWLQVSMLGASLLVCILSLLGVRELARLLDRRGVVVGADRVTLEARGKRPFVPYAAVASVVRTDGAIPLRRRDGRRVDLPVQAKILPPLPADPDTPFTSPDVREAFHRRELLHGRIRRAMAAAAKEHTPIDV